MSTRTARTAVAQETSAMVATTGLTRGQVRWASEHDWFVDWYIADGALTVLVREVSSTPKNKAVHTLIEFTDWRELRAWAGY